MWEPHTVIVHKDDIAAYNAECPRFKLECLRYPWDSPPHDVPRFKLNCVPIDGEWYDFDELEW